MNYLTKSVEKFQKIKILKFDEVSREGGRFVIRSFARTVETIFENLKLVNSSNVTFYKENQSKKMGWKKILWSKKIFLNEKVFFFPVHFHSSFNVFDVFTPNFDLHFALTFTFLRSKSKFYSHFDIQNILFTTFSQLFLMILIKMCHWTWENGMLYFMDFLVQIFKHWNNSTNIMNNVKEKIKSKCRIILTFSRKVNWNHGFFRNPNFKGIHVFLLRLWEKHEFLWRGTPLINQIQRPKFFIITS